MADQIPPSPLPHSPEMEVFSGKLIETDTPLDAKRLDALTDTESETLATEGTQRGLLELVQQITDSVPTEFYGKGDFRRGEKKVTIDEGGWGKVEVFSFPHRGGIGSVGSPGKLTGRGLVEVHIRKNRSDGGQTLVRVGLDESQGSLNGRLEEYSLTPLQAQRNISPWSDRDTVIDTPLSGQLDKPFLTELALGINNPMLVRSSGLKESEALTVDAALRTILSPTQS